MDIRIQKVLSEQGFCSRRAAEELIKKGKVKLNGHIASLGDRMDPAKDVLSVGGERVYLTRKVEKVYYMLHKPRGYVTTLDDRHAKKNVLMLMTGVENRVFPVGRLDKDSEGLILMTNDGDFANLIAHPSGGISKTYRVSVKPAATEKQLSMLASGVEIEGGLSAPAAVRVTGDQADRTTFEIVLREGRNREIRKMCGAVELEVTRLKRTAVGPLQLGNLPAGRYRELKKQEVIAVRGACKRVGKQNGDIKDSR